MHALHPGMHDVYGDPGRGNTVTIAEAALPVRTVHELSRLWDQVLDIVERERPAKLSPLLEGLHAWVHPGTLAFGRGVDEAIRASIGAVAADVVSRLTALLQGRPGALRRLREYSVRGRLGVSI